MHPVAYHSTSLHDLSQALTPPQLQSYRGREHSDSVQCSQQQEALRQRIKYWSEHFFFSLDEIDHLLMQWKQFQLPDQTSTKPCGA